MAGPLACLSAAAALSAAQDPPRTDIYPVELRVVDGRWALWRLGPGGEGDLLFADVQPVGYHAWLDGDRAVRFVLGDPPSLHLADRREPGSRVVARRVGRSLQRMPGEAGASFPQLVNRTWWITRLAVSPSGGQVALVGLDSPPPS
jgi:hypothetical protein